MSANLGFAIETLVQSLGQPRVVRVRRSIRRADVLDGFVVGIGKQWVLLHNVADVNLDGYAAIRKADVKSVKVRADDGSFTLRALAHNGEHSTPLPTVGLDSTAEVVTGFQTVFPLVNIQTENEHPDECYIGRVAGLTRRTLRLREINPDATWDDEPTNWPLAHITRVDADGPYERVLAELGGNPTSA